MKKIMGILFVFNLAALLYAQVSIPDFVYTFGEDGICYLGYNNNLYEYDSWAKKYHNITDQCYIDDNGFLRIDYTKSELTYFTIKEDTYYLLLSSKHFLILTDDSRINLFQGQAEPPYGYSDLFIKNISSNLHLREGAVSYSADNLPKRFFATDREFRYDYWSNTLPLAVSNEQLSQFQMNIEFEGDVEGILILNGFVDFSRSHLYKDNRRAKEIKIFDQKNNIEITYELKDQIQFQEISFAKPTDNITIEISSYYDGEKYSDVCISAITPVFNDEMFRESRLLSIPDYQEVIKNIKNVYAEIL
jgi:hypothetical protein